MTRKQRLLRFLKRLGVGVLVALSVLVLALVLLTQTSPGRALIVRIAMPYVDGAIPGRIEIRELARLRPSGVELRGVRVFDPVGAEVIRVELIRVEISPGDLVDGRIVVPEVELRTGAVDLRTIAEERRGIVAAFVDPTAPKSPPSNAPPPYVRVDRILVSELDVRAPAAGSLGQLDAKGIALEARYELDRTSAATLRRFSLRIEREKKPLAVIRELGATLERGRKPSGVKLRLTLLEHTELELEAKVVAPPEPTFKKEPLSVTLGLKDVTAARLATLLQNPALEKAFEGSVSASLTVSGTIERLRSDLSLETEGGKLSLHAEADDFERLRARLETEELRPDRVRADAPPRRVKLDLEASADVKDTQQIPVKVAIRDSAVDGTPLPELTVASTITPKSAKALDLSATDGKSRVAVKGDVDFAGAVDAKVDLLVEPAAIEKWSRFAGRKVDATGEARAKLAVKVDPTRHIDVSGEVHVEHLKAPDVEIERGEVTIRLRGEATHPEGEVGVHIERAKFAGKPVPKLELRAQGGPRRYKLGLDAEVADSTVFLDTTVERGDREIAVEAEGHGTFKKQPWKLSIKPTKVAFTGELDTEGIEAELSEQGVEVHGKFAKEGGEITFGAKSIDLARFSNLLALGEPLRGKVELHGRLYGKPKLPGLELDLAGRGLSLGERPPLNLDLAAALNTEGGEGSVKLALEAERGRNGGRPLALELDARHRFRGGPGFERAILDGNLDATLEFTRVESTFVADWAKLEALPVKGTISGKVHAKGTKNDPELEASFDGDALVLGAPLKPKVMVAYEKGDGHVEVRVDDERGRLLDLAATLRLPGEPPGIEAIAARLPRAIGDASWSVTLMTGERKLVELPGLRDAKIPASAAASLLLEHEPGAEPTGKFRVFARPTTELDAGQNASCKPSRTSIELTGELASGRLRTEIMALDAQKKLLESTVEAEIALVPALAGGLPKLGRVHAEALADHLELGTLPLVCGAARGTVDLRARIEDPLGSRPELSARLSAKKLSLGSDETVDVDLKAELTQKLAKADGSILALRGLSTLKAELPITFEHGKTTVANDAPITLDVTLSRLPIAPFLNPRGNISYATGFLDGTVQARGKLRDPQLKGSITLREIAFTATDLAQPVHDVGGTLSFTRNEVIVKGFEARDRDGVIKIDGGARFSDAEHVNVALDLRAKEFPIRQQGQVVATTELEAKVKAKLEPGKTDVTIDLGKVDMWIESLDTRSGIALAAHSDFVIDGKAPPKAEKDDADEAMEAEAEAKGAREVKKKAPARVAPKNAKAADPEDPLTLLTLNANDGVWIKRDDFAVKLKASLKTKIQGDATRVEGKVGILRGYLTLMGKNFEIQKGSGLTFTGATRPNPMLDIVAIHENRRSGNKISVVISGRADKPILTFKVDDKEVSAGEAFQAIYGSQQSNQDPNGANDQAKEFAGALTAGLLATTARRELGAAAPIIMIEPGSDTGSGRVRAGFEFDSLVPTFLKDVVTGVYFEGIVGKEDTGKSEQNDARTQAGVLLEFYFPRNFFTSGQYGPGPTWSMDVGWQL